MPKCNIFAFLFIVQSLGSVYLRKERKNLFLIVNGKFAYNENLNMKYQKQ